MIRAFDHVTVVVRDLDAARRFFALLGFKEERAVVISSAVMERYMGVPGIVADHVTLVHASATPRLEVQLLRYQAPPLAPGATIPPLTGLGYNHVCFAVDDLDALVRRLVAAGVGLQNEVMTFHDRKLVFLDGPEGITVELAEWQRPTPADGDARIAILRAAYDAFNRRDLDGASAMLADDVAWPDMLEGRVLHGIAAVRAYWTRQQESIRSHVAPLRFESHGERVLVTVAQRVRRRDADHEDSSTVGHLYWFRGDRVVRMVVHSDLAVATAALHAPDEARS